MSLTRSNNGRSQSRSPIPHTATLRPFLPPSHYAAAAGIPYDGNKHITDTMKSNSNDPYTRAFVSAYPYDAEPDSQSSFEFKPTTVEDKPPAPPKLNRRSRRESLLNDLPQLEANLLPSLRDTIDRMTKSPSQPEPSSTSHLSIPRPSGAFRSSRSLSPSYASREKLLIKSVTPEPSTRGLSSSADVLTPRTNTPAKSQRSTLRPPAPKLHLKASGDSPPSTLRSILKKIPIHDAAPSVPEGGLSRRSTVSNGSKPAIQTLRSRSRTNPGTLPTTTDQPLKPSVVEHTNTQPTPRLQPSAIPRLQSKRTGAGIWWSTDDSDVDGQEKPRGRDRRQLIVPRVVSQSTSESESETRKGARAGARRDSLYGSQLVGLGIGLGSEKKKTKGGASHPSMPTHPDISLRSTRRITGDRTPRQSNSSTFDAPSEHKQHREVLRDIVSNLKLDDNPTESESDYDGEEGVAISGSQTFAEATQTQCQTGTRADVHVDSDHDQEYKEAKVPSSTRRLRPRSTSHTPTPTFLVSPNPDITSNTKFRTPIASKRHLGPPRTPILKEQAQSQYESSSRLPIISQIDTPATPAALRRHSVYHRSASPNVLTPVISNDDRLPVDRSSSSIGVPKGQRGSSQQRREGTSINVKTTAAVPNMEYEVITCDSIGAYEDRRDDNQPPLPHTESDLSSVGSMYLGDDSESELSPAAETLFRKLGQGKTDRKTSSEKVLRSSVVFRTPSPSLPVPIADNLRQARSVSRHEDYRPRSRLASPPPPPPPSVPVEPSNDYNADDIELRRQDLIIEIQQCEEAFVKRLHVFVQFFILPLRVQDTKEWIAGVPTEIARLFDWLEDIVVLHTQILASLESTRDAQYPAVERIAEAIRAFVPRLEVYQPYLVNLEYVIGLAEELLESENDFGEFVRLQEKAEECEGWNFQSFLIEPVNLLARFPGLFNRLLELTPKSHRDYMPTLALVRSTEMFIRVMTEVKLREDEYDMIQHFAARIQGLPSSTHLATRERRLLHHGILHLVDVEANDLPAVAGTCTSALIRYFPPGISAAGTSTSTTANSNRPGLSTAIHQWDSDGCIRSGSTSSSSTNTGVSLSSIKASSSGASSIFFSSFKMALPKGRLRPSTTRRPPSPSPAPRGGINNSNLNVDLSLDLNSGIGISRAPRGTPVRVFVFSDLLVLAALSGSSSGLRSGSGSPKNEDEDEDEVWTLLNHIGTTRILHVKLEQENDDLDDGHESLAEDANLITIEVFSVDTQRLNHAPNRDLDQSSVFALHLEVPAPMQASDDTASPQDVKRRWTTSLLRSHRTTLCSLSTPPYHHHSNHHHHYTHGYDPYLDAAIDRHETVRAILASGLPLPKSPSMLLAGAGGSAGGKGEVKRTGKGVIGKGMEEREREEKEEREERGWWSLRFQEVFREAVRREGLMGLGG